MHYVYRQVGECKHKFRRMDCGKMGTSVWEIAEKISIVSVKAAGGAGGSFLPRDLHGHMRYVR